MTNKSQIPVFNDQDVGKAPPSPIRWVSTYTKAILAKQAANYYTKMIKNLLYFDLVRIDEKIFLQDRRSVCDFEFWSL